MMRPASATGELVSRNILGVRIDAANYDVAVAKISHWSSVMENRRVHIVAVHGVMEAFDDHSFRTIVNSGDFNTSDGMPLVWSLRSLGARHAKRVYGPELTPRLLETAAREGIPVGFYGGSSDEALKHLIDVALNRFPGLNIAYAWSPPFRPLTPDEDAKVRAEIESSGTRLLFVGLGCPKQERWMAKHRDLPVTMVGVGAAFDFLAGNKKQAPRFIQSLGFEWLFRLVTEPRRLWKRYAKHNPRFVIHFFAQKLGLRRYDP